MTTERTDSALVRSLAREIAEAVGAYLRTGAQRAIDLRSLPMSDADRVALERWLGEGEIRATLSVAGRSDVRETRFSGVWWVRHFGDADRIAAERIEITAIPEILSSDVADIAAALTQLEAELAVGPFPPSMEEVEHD